MSKYLPKEDQVYFSPFKKEEVLVRLGDILEPEKMVRIRFFGLGRRSGKFYEGSINNDSFEMKRIIGYKNSFIPKISGNVENTLGGSLIHVKMRLHVFVMIFMIVWMSLVGIAALICTLVLIIGGRFNPFLLIPIGMFLFGYLLTLGAFKYESARTKEDLKQIFEATIE
ncbi:MAG: hypothetical protein QE487_02870 [Fluviicola sp.]|nr:hypothetical protein [Fluviicola sp.]